MYSYMSTSYHANKKIWQEWEREGNGGRWTNVERGEGEKQTETKYLKMTNRPSTVHGIIAINFRREMALFLMY